MDNKLYSVSPQKHAADMDERVAPLIHHVLRNKPNQSAADLLIALEERGLKLSKIELNKILTKLVQTNQLIEGT